MQGRVVTRGGCTPPPLNFHGAGGRGRRPWLCHRARSSITGADGPQAEERAMAADAHCIARVLCDEFLFFVFLTEALKKHVLSGCKKKVPPNSVPLISIRTVLPICGIVPNLSTYLWYLPTLCFLIGLSSREDKE